MDLEKKSEVESKVEFDKHDLNQFIIKLRVPLRNIRSRTIVKLARDAKKLDSKKYKTEQEKMKNQRKADRLREEITILKKYDIDDLSKLVILSTKSYTDVVANPSHCIMERTICRIRETDKMKIVVDNFCEKHPNSQKLIPNLIKSLGVLHRQDRMKQLKMKGKLDKFLAKEVEIFKFMKELYGVDIDPQLLINRTMEQEDISEEINTNLISPLKEKLVKAPVIKNAISKIKPEQNNISGLKEPKRRPNTNQNEQETIPDESLVVKNVEDSDDGNSDTNNEFDSDDELSSEDDISQGHEGYEITSMFKTVDEEEDAESCSNVSKDDGISDENIKVTDTKKTLGTNGVDSLRSKTSNFKKISDTSNEVRGVDLEKLKENNCFFVSNSVKIDDSDDESEDENCEKAVGSNQTSFFVGRQCSEEVQSEGKNHATDYDDAEVDSSKYFKKNIFRKQPEKSLNFKSGGFNMNEVPKNRRQRRILEGKSRVDPGSEFQRKLKPKESRNFKGRDESFSKIGKERPHRPNKRSYDSNDPNEVPLGEMQSGLPALKKKKITPESAKPVAAAIHPSWAAKKANSGSIHSFQGKKTTFDD